MVTHDMLRTHKETEIAPYERNNISTIRKHFWKFSIHCLSVIYMKNQTKYFTGLKYLINPNSIVYLKTP